MRHVLYMQVHEPSNEMHADWRTLRPSVRGLLSTAWNDRDGMNVGLQKSSGLGESPDMDGQRSTNIAKAKAKAYAEHILLSPRHVPHLLFQPRVELDPQSSWLRVHFRAD